MSKKLSKKELKKRAREKARENFVYETGSKKRHRETAAEKFNREIAIKLYDLAKKWNAAILSSTDFVDKARMWTDQVRSFGCFRNDPVMHTAIKKQQEQRVGF